MSGTNQWEDGLQIVDVRIANHGPDTAEDVQAAIDLPVGTSSVVLLSAGCRQAGEAVVCDLGDLAPDATGGVHAAFSVPTPPPEGAAVTAAVTSATQDPTGRDNVVRLPTTG